MIGFTLSVYKFRRSAMLEKKPVGCIIPHTHWDREWRYPIWKNRILLVEFMDELLDILDTDPQYKCFLMDGQSIVILYPSS